MSAGRTVSAGRTPFDIAIPIYPKVDLLDVAAPHEMFKWINSYSRASRSRCRWSPRTAGSSRRGTVSS